jgi:hypothetical protein
MDVAADAGLLSLSPSDLVFESSAQGIHYYDFVLSTAPIFDETSNPPSVVLPSSPPPSTNTGMAFGSGVVETTNSTGTVGRKQVFIQYFIYLILFFIN